MERRVRVAGGKTLALDFQCQGDEVVKITISGDFFFYPEEGLERLEAFLVDNKVWRSDDAESIIADHLKENDYQAVGFGPADLAFLLRGLKC